MEGDPLGEWERSKVLFAQALESPPEHRDAVVTRECRGDAVLRQDVWSLVTSDAEAADFLERPAASLLASLSEPGPVRRLDPGDRIDRYEIDAFLGAGAVSEVYRATDSRLGRVVALKILTDPTAPDAHGWLLREARHAATLNHPHICTVHEVDEWEGQTFIVLEHIDGVTLHAARRAGPLPLPTVVRWGSEIADALDHAHRRGVVHRDLKASNVLVTSEQHVKVLDFGLARRLDVDAGDGVAASVLADASVAGTLTHIAPEVLRGGPADARVDIWALGVLLYELADGSLPFTGATAFATATAILEATPAPLSTTVPPAFRQVVERCLSKDPAMRYRSAIDVRDALDACGRSLATSRRTPGFRRAVVAAVLTLSTATAAYLASDAIGTATRPNRSEPPVLAVLPFVEPDGDESPRFLTDGVTEALIGELGRIDAIRVIAPGSTRAYRGRDGLVGEVGRDTGAEAVLTGTVSRVGDRTRLVVRLIHVSSGRVLWSSDYDRHTRELQAAYGEVAQEVAHAVEVGLRDDVAIRLTRVRAVDPDVYEAYLKGRYYWSQRTSESLRTAIAHYETAVRLDPTYAPAYAALADCYNQLGTQMVGSGSPREWRPKAAEAAIRALQIDPELAEAHATLGYVRHYEWEWAAAERSFRRAIELNPSYALARIWYANLLSGRSRVDEAMVQVTAAAELDPLAPLIGTNVAWVMINARRYDEAIATLTAIVARDPGYVQAHSRLAAAYSFSGRHREAVAAAEVANRLAADSVATRASLAQALALAGRRHDAEALLERLLTDRADQHVPTGAVANVYAALNQEEDALQWLEQSHAERTNNNAYLAVEPVYDSLRSHARFQALLRATGLP